ncbi:hypothetical protein P817_02859 [Klebsiella aerogenes UCI 15]|nr:hypothetical protein P817_02859 [Klebsiella aerogenes UCI 15]
MHQPMTMSAFMKRWKHADTFAKSRMQPGIGFISHQLNM